MGFDGIDEENDGQGGRCIRRGSSLRVTARRSGIGLAAAGGMNEISDRSLKVGMAAAAAPTGFQVSVDHSRAMAHQFAIGCWITS